MLGSASAGIAMCGFRCLILWLERSVLRLRRAVVVVEEWEVLAQLVDELVGVDGLAHDDETVDQKRGDEFGELLRDCCRHVGSEE